LAMTTPVSSVAQPVIVEPGWTLIRTTEFENPMAAHYNPVDGSLYVGRRGTSSDGLYRIDRLGFAAQLAGGSNLGGPLAVPFGSTVKPGDTVDLSVTLTAPMGFGAYESRWQLRDADGRLFGQPIQVDASGVAVAPHILDQDLGLAQVRLVPVHSAAEGIHLQPLFPNLTAFRLHHFPCSFLSQSRPLAARSYFPPGRTSVLDIFSRTFSMAVWSS